MTHTLAPILLVEDEHDDVEFVRRALSARKIVNPLVVFSDVDSAKTYLLGSIRRNALPVVALLDIYLPRSASGLDLLAWMRADPRLVKLPAIVLSVSTDFTHEASALGSGGTLLLRKPITPEIIVDAIRSLCITVNQVSDAERSGLALVGQR